MQQLERLIDAVAYEAAERAIKRLPAPNTLAKCETLAEALAKAIREWLEKNPYPETR
jgi:dihydroneopterin aldolase